LYAKTVNIFNKRAKFDYEIIETFNAGIVLAGTEIKSIQAKSLELLNSATANFCNKYISEYTFETNSTTARRVKLLLRN
jgi:SsrA-binding protein